MKPKRPIDNTAGINAMSGAANVMSAVSDYEFTHSRNELNSWLGSEEGYEVIYKMWAAIFTFGVMAFLFLAPTLATDYPQWLPDWAISFFAEPLWATVFMLFFGFCAFSIGVALYGLTTPYIGMKMRLRVYEPGSDEALKSGYAAFPHAMPVEILLIMPVKIAAFFCLVYPVLLLIYGVELVRGLVGLITGNSYNPKGDVSFYYTRMQRRYAEVFAIDGEAAAENMLRRACQGVFTGRNVPIPRENWNSSVRDALIGRFYSEFGPIDKFVTNRAPQPVEFTDDGEIRPISSKYDVI